MSSPQGINPGLDTGTGTQRADPDAACQYSIVVNSQSVEDVKKSLDFKVLTSLGCRVLKHPNCCVLCAANNDCARLPMHWNCRCRPEGYLTFTELAVT